VHYERLLLPFGKDGSAVDGLMICLEISSPEGPFDTSELKHPPAKGPAMGLCATILQ
jgi:hypothetical protein